MDRTNLGQMVESIETPEYKQFVEKFKPKKTTDDCYTPGYIYDALLKWVVKEYKLEGRRIVRPFYPGGDYENYKYPEKCVVVDNPPFSILAKIVDFYLENKIDFFLFAPTMTLFSCMKNRQVNSVISGTDIVYENGAIVHTSFLSNMGEYKINVCSELHNILTVTQKENLKTQRDKTETPKYEYPNEVVSAAILTKIAKHGCDLKVRAEDCYFTRTLEAQKEYKKTIYGGGFLLSEKATAERVAAERAAAERAAAEKAICWKLSEREVAIVKGLGKRITK